MEVKVGDVIRIIEMKGEPMYTNRTGTVTCIDDIGQIHGTWGGCAIRVECDFIEMLDSECDNERCAIEALNLKYGESND